MYYTTVTEALNGGQDEIDSGLGHLMWFGRDRGFAWVCAEAMDPANDPDAECHSMTLSEYAECHLRRGGATQDEITRYFGGWEG